MTIDRRIFIGSLAAGGAVVGPGRALSSSGRAEHGERRQPAGASPGVPRRALDWFPALRQQVNGRPLAYLDSAATTLRPSAVIAAISGFYETDNANPGAALHTLARRSAERLAGARARVARFLGARDPAEIVFTKGTTEAINLVASSWGAAAIASGDEIVVSIAEHYSNLLPWRTLARRVGARLRLVDVDDGGRLDPARVREALSPRTKLVALSHVSNVLGLVNPVSEIAALVKARGVPLLVDGAQSVPHVPTDVGAIGCDFLACSAHKMLGPMGLGVLWARRETLDRMPPYQVGSNMAHDVTDAGERLEHGALKYQAGTPNVAGPVGLAAALDVLDEIGLDTIGRHDRLLVDHARERFARVPGLRVLGTMEESSTRLPVFSFALPGVPASRLVRSLDEAGVALRGGDMAALPLLQRFGLHEAVRASCYLYTTLDDIDRLCDRLEIEARAGR